MPVPSVPTFLFASDDPQLLETAQIALGDGCAELQFVREAGMAQERLSAQDSPALAVIDEQLPGIAMEPMLAQVRTDARGRRFPIVALVERATPEWLDRLAAGVIDDVELRQTDAGMLAARLEAVLRNHARLRELEMLREASALHAQTDRLTGVYNRDTMLSMLFRETDRVQRMKSSLCMILFDIDDFGHWNQRLGEAACDDLLRQVVARTSKLLRSYDLLGRVGKDEFMLGLPGCSSANAVTLAERLRQEVFTTPFRTGGEAIRLSACFGVATSLGRSPVVVLHEAEQALGSAQAMGPESIQCAGDFPEPAPAPVTFLSENSGDELLAW